MREAPDGYETEFNAGIATLIRIDAIKKRIANSYFCKDYLDWFRALQLFYGELRPFLNKENKKDMDEKFEKAIKLYFKMEDSIMRGKPILYSEVQSLYLVELELRDLEQTYGLNMPRKPDARFAMARRA